MSIKQTYTVIVKPFEITQKEQVAEQWLLLERGSNSSVFLSWQWISPWLELVTGKIFLVEALYQNKIVGLGFFVEKTRKVFGCFPIKQWWLHRTGDQQQDQIWIEYNDFLLDESCSVQVREQMIKAVASFDYSVKEVIIGLSSADNIGYFTRAFKALNFLEATLIKTSGYLASLSNTTVDYLNKTLSKNTRSQVSRSSKALQSQGKLNFEVLSSPEKISQLLPKIADIHIDIWGNTREGSGFSNPVFKRFHQSIINHTDNLVQIAILTLNEEALGYLVNFVYHDKVYFYLSALQKNADNKVKVGMSLHCEAIKYYAAQGVESYDFLGGDARYKKSLSNESYTLEMKCYSRNEFLLRTEALLKKFKARLVAMFTKSS